MTKWPSQRRAISVAAIGLGIALVGYALSVRAQERPVNGASTAAALFDTPAGKEKDDYDGRLKKIEAAIAVINNRLGRMVQQPTLNNSIEKRLEELERQVVLLERQIEGLQRRIQKVELKK